MTGTLGGHENMTTKQVIFLLPKFSLFSSKTFNAHNNKNYIEKQKILKFEKLCHQTFEC